MIFLVLGIEFKGTSNGGLCALILFIFVVYIGKGIKVRGNRLQFDSPLRQPNCLLQIDL